MVRTRRLGTASAAGGGGGVTATVFTCPADRTAIVKDLRFYVTANTAVITSILKLDVLLLGVTSRTLWHSSIAAAYVGPVYWGAGGGDTPWVVLQETDVLRLTIPAALTAQCYASGALLDGDPA